MTHGSSCSTASRTTRHPKRLTPEGVGRRRPLLAASVALIVVGAALAGLVLASQQDSTSHNQVVVPPASDNGSSVVPYEPANDLVPYVDPTTASILPGRIAVSGPDGNWAGFADRDVLAGVPNYAAHPDDPEAAVAPWQRVRIAVTKTADPASELVGYYFPGAGFIDLHTYNSPAFDLDALVANGNAREQQEQQLARDAGIIK